MIVPYFTEIYSSLEKKNVYGRSDSQLSSGDASVASLEFFSYAAQVVS